MRKALVPLLIALAVATLAGWHLLKAVSFKADLATAVGQVFGALLLVALFVERLVEVVVSIWREPEQDKLDAKLAMVTDKNDVAVFGKEAEATSTKQQIADYKAVTGVFASSVGLCIGVIVAAVGFRVLESLLEPASLSQLVNWQQKMLVGVDVFLTGAVLSGGSDAVHKIFNAFNSFMDAARRQADNKAK